MKHEADLDQHPVAPVSALVDTVPVVDIGGLMHGKHIDPDDPAVQQIADAARRWGFFQVVNHGVSDADVEKTWSETRRLFAQTTAEKESLLRTRDNPWGYYNNELTKNQRDKKEVFDFTTAGNDPIYLAANRWPDANDRFKQVMLNYLWTCTQLSLRLLQAFCAGLGIAANHLEREFSPEHTGFVRLNHYPVQDPMQGSNKAYLPTADLGIHHHTDAGALTVLLQDAVGGLQVHHDGQWHNVPVIDNAFVINTGDMMQVWSNDHYRAAVHRVLAMDTTERYSIPFFFNPSARTTVEPLPSMVSDDRPSHYRQINWVEFRSGRTDGDYANYGSEVQISDYRV
jgi:isopenicillin N synthase-like dioxygenase